MSPDNYDSPMKIIVEGNQSRTLAAQALMKANNSKLHDKLVKIAVTHVSFPQ